MDLILPLIGLGSLLIFIVLIIISLIGLILKKKWSKRGFIISLIPLFLLFVCITIDGNIDYNAPEAAYEDEVDSQEEIEIDFDKFIHTIEKFTYNSEDNSVDIEVSTNIPNGTNVIVGLDKMNSADSLDDEYFQSIVDKLTWDREDMIVEDGKLSLHYNGSDARTILINGQYGVWLSFDIGEFTNQELLSAIGNAEEAEKRFPENTILGSEYEYMVIVGHEYFDITNSISLNDLKILEQEKTNQKKAEAKEIRFAELDKNPAKHFGEFVKYQGEVLQIMEDSTSTTIRLAVTKKSYGYSPNDVIYITYDGTTPYVKDDVITVYGSVMGAHTYESQAGYMITLPHIEAEIIE